MRSGRIPPFRHTSRCGGPRQTSRDQHRSGSCQSLARCLPPRALPAPYAAGFEPSRRLTARPHAPRCSARLRQRGGAAQGATCTGPARRARTIVRSHGHVRRPAAMTSLRMLNHVRAATTPSVASQSFPPASFASFMLPLVQETINHVGQPFGLPDYLRAVLSRQPAVPAPSRPPPPKQARSRLAAACHGMFHATLVRHLEPLRPQ